MSEYEKESELIAYCGLYCRLCDYFTGRIRDSARDLLGFVQKHRELKLFADTAKAFDFGNFVEGLKWVSEEFSPCVGGCRGGGGWRDCPMRKCCIERSARFCYECADFPCETLKSFPKRVDELSRIKKTGLERWIKQRLEQNAL